MSFAMNAALINNNENMDNNFDNNKNNKKNSNVGQKNKTYKNSKINHGKSMAKMQAVAREAYASSSDLDDETELVNFSPLPNTCSTSGQKHIESLEQKLKNMDAPSNQEFSKLPESYSQDYYKHTIPAYYQEKNEHNNTSNAELLKKLDNILHILEEQSEEKTNYIMEELILYVFLGVFIIFVLDSFVRVGKYVR